MPVRQVIFVLAISAILLVAIIELVRRRRLREEYALLWLIASIAAPAVVLFFPLIRKFTRLVGADEPVSILYFLALVFLVMINMHYSTKISQLAEQVKTLAQELAIATAQDPDEDEEGGCCSS